MLYIAISVLFAPFVRFARHKSAAWVLVCALILPILLVLRPGTAHALDEIYSPIVEYHELATEISGSQTFDDDPAKDNAKALELVLEYGLTPWMTLAASGGYENTSGDNLRFVDYQIEAPNIRS